MSNASVVYVICEYNLSDKYVNSFIPSDHYRNSSKSNIKLPMYEIKFPYYI